MFKLKRKVIIRNLTNLHPKLVSLKNLKKSSSSPFFDFFIIWFSGKKLAIFQKKENLEECQLMIPLNIPNLPARSTRSVKFIMFLHFLETQVIAISCLFSKESP